MIKEQSIEKAVDWLRDTANAYGTMRGHVQYTEANLRRVKALEMSGKVGGVGEREAAAYASDAYLAAMVEYRNAVAECETMRALREAADLRIRVWQTQESSSRRGVI